MFIKNSIVNPIKFQILCITYLLSIEQSNPPFPSYFFIVSVFIFLVKIIDTARLDCKLQIKFSQFYKKYQPTS
jgi:hypothetical protein